MVFPEKFVWGAAAASYQIEGAHDADGKGESVWDMFVRKPGTIHRGHHGDVACDHVARYQEDVALWRSMGLQAYRFSVSWPRVLPSGVGRVNEAGLGFYDRLVDALLSAGITPYATCFHWDFPVELYRRGGWLNRDSASWFADYVAVITERLSDRVEHWMTLNEPQCFVLFGHDNGQHAPGDKLRLAEVMTVHHHALLAHGKAVQALRAHARRPLQIGYAPVGVVAVPASEDPRDQAAADRRMASVDAGRWDNVSWSDPVCLGRYPEQASWLGLLPRGFEQDLPTIAQPIDFFGTNIYVGQKVRAGADGEPELASEPPGSPQTALSWPVVPSALFHGPRFLYERYRKPILITENGLSNRDWVALDGAVHDPARIDFMTRYLRELHRATQAGVPVLGYFHWSVMDNFEWGEGYKDRFGLIHVDYQTQKRTLKDSAHWYKQVIATNGAALY